MRLAYRCDPDATSEWQKQINELMNKGIVRESLSPCAVPALLVPKKDGTWRMCIDSRAINNITVKYRFSLYVDSDEGVDSEDDWEGLFENFPTEESSPKESEEKKCMKKGEYKWTYNAQQAFNLLKRMLCEAPVLRLPDFNRLFEVESDANGVGIEALMHWSHYLKPKPFVLHLDHETLKYFNGQHKLNHRHAKWAELLQSFTFSSKYKEGKQNIVVDALSRSYSLLTVMELKVLGFEFMKELYKDSGCHTGAVLLAQNDGRCQGDAQEMLHLPAG
ncbi:uncharacterized protein LOC141655430 [Silene latifolia]|uniref:uncharacterized protein LOC141655430 n=1 Tax=Silene latifolia TaxID=37657 RepID=UPI003D784BE2